jgi:hypothetical protein
MNVTDILMWVVFVDFNVQKITISAPFCCSLVIQLYKNIRVHMGVCIY